MNKTPIEKAIEEFETLKSKAETVRDILYLDGVLAVLDSVKQYEKDYLQNPIIKQVKNEMGPFYTHEDMNWAFEQGVHEGKLRTHYENNPEQFSSNLDYYLKMRK